jgi:hypothetical protein
MMACPSLFPFEETEHEGEKAGERQEGMSKSPSRKNMDRGVDKEGGEERAEGGAGPEEGGPREVFRSAEAFFSQREKGGGGLGEDASPAVMDVEV